MTGLLYGAVNLRHPDTRPERDADDPCLVSLSSHLGGVRTYSNRDGACLLALAGTSVVGEGVCRPTAHADGRYILALDGWLADRTGLIAALGPEEGGAATDNNLIASALLRWGDAGLDRLHGQFAIAWWDRSEQRLLLACDRTGGRTLFYHQSPSGAELRFASAIGVLLADPAIPRQIDPMALAGISLYGSFGFNPRTAVNTTCFAGIDQIVAAHKLVMTRNSIRVEPYWRLDHTRRIRFRRDGDYVDAARELLDRVVADNLRGLGPQGQGPIVSMLSGGLDSSAVTTTAARLVAPGPVHSLTARSDPATPALGSGDRWFTDEWPHAQATAALYPNIRAELCQGQFEPVEDWLRRQFRWTGRPPVNLIAGIWYQQLWCRVRELRAPALLGGRAGNATLTASALSTFVHPDRLGDWPSALADAWAHVRYTPDHRTLLNVLRGLVPRSAKKWLRAAGHSPPWLRRTGLSPAYRDMADVDNVWAAQVAGIGDAPFRRRWRIMLMESNWHRSSLFSPMRHVHGFEYRDPLGDVRMAEFCFSLPDDQFTRGRQDRFLARRVLDDRLPASVVTERRKGRQLAEWHDWMTRLRPWMRTELDRLDDSALGREMIDLPRLRATLDNWPDDAATAEPRYLELTDALGGGIGLGMFLRWAEGSNH